MSAPRPRWREVNGIAVDAAFLRALEAAGGPQVLGYPITPSVFAGDTLQQYFDHGRLDAPGRSTPHAVGVPRVAELGRALARALRAPPAQDADDGGGERWTDESRRAAAGRPVSAPLRWRGWRMRIFEREVVRYLERSPVDALPHPGRLGELFVALDDQQRRRGQDGPAPVMRPSASAAGEVHAPILTYHLTRGAAAFRAQLEGLLEAGFTPVSLEHLVAAVEGWAELPPRACVVSFDDGWAVQLDAALPVLLDVRVPAVFFVLPEFHRHGQGHMTVDDFRGLRAQGITVGSHTFNHAHLPSLAASNLSAAQAEVIESRAWLETEVDGVDFFAYPGGSFDDGVKALAAAAGYRAAVTTLPGIVHRPERLLELRRVAVQAWWPLADVLQAIRNAAQVDGAAAPI